MTITIPYLRRRPARVTPRAILPDLSEQECRKLLDPPRTASGSRAWSTRPRKCATGGLNLIRAAFRGDDAEGRFYHGYYDCYCYLPLYVFCEQAADAKDEVARFIRQIRARWRRVKILASADSGFAREELWLGVRRTVSTTSSASPATRAWSPPSRSISLWASNSGLAPRYLNPLPSSALTCPADRHSL